MKPCPHETEVQAILQNGHWPEACEPEFRNHLETCSKCREQLLVLQAFHAARAEAVQAARVGHPNLLWWRAQLRRRNEAIQRVGKPITTAQIFALCIAIFAAAALLKSQIQKGWNWSSWLPEPSGVSRFDVQSLFTSAESDWGLLLLLTGLCTVVLLSALAVYLATDRK